MTHAAGQALLIAILLLLSGDAAVAIPPSTLFANPNGPAPQLEPQQAAETCAEFKELYANIDADLARWKEDGIPLELMQQTIAEHTTRKGGQKGIAVAFLDGKAYLLDEPNLTGVGHHANLLFMYMRLMVHLEQTFRMPDVVRFLGRQAAAACELLGRMRKEIGGPTAQAQEVGSCSLACQSAAANAVGSATRQYRTALVQLLLPT